MKPPKTKHAVLMVAALIAFSCTKAKAQEKSPQVAANYVYNIHGSVKLLQKGAIKPVVLDAKKDQYRPIAPGDKVMADAGGAATLELYGKSVPIKGPSSWYPVPNIPTTALSAKVAALRTSTRIGGRARGDGLLSPWPLGAVRAGSLVVRWISARSAGNGSFEVSDTNGGSVWFDQHVSMASGKIDSPAFRTALTHYREAPRTPMLRMVLTPEIGQTVQVDFHVLSVDEEKKLASDLAEWDKEAGLLRTIGRADVLARQGMMYEAAQEFEDALAKAPQSRALIQETLDAEDVVGNIPRVRALRELLAKLQ
jgi:hypothetical protein